MKKIAVLLFIIGLLASSCTKQVSNPESTTKETIYIRVQSTGTTTDYSPVAFIKL